MSAIKIVAILLIVVGILALVYGGFTYTKETHNAQMGNMHFSFHENQTVNIPVWAGVGAVVAGGALMLLGRKKP